MILLDRLGSYIQALGQRDEAYIDRFNPAQGTGYRRVARFVGLIAIGLPIGMWLVSALSNECFYNSVSHYFYARWVGAVFVAALAFLGSFLIGYTGENALEGRLAFIAGVLIIIVAIIPTGGVGCEDVSQIRQIFAHVEVDQTTVSISPVEQGETSSYFQIVSGGAGDLLIFVHLFAAGLVLVIMAVFAFFVFTRVDLDTHVENGTGRLLPLKRRRNLIYIASGFMILCCLATLIFSSVPAIETPSVQRWNALNLTFWFETLAFFAFGFSWLLRGRFFGNWMVDQHEVELIRRVGNRSS